MDLLVTSRKGELRDYHLRITRWPSIFRLLWIIFLHSLTAIPAHSSAYAAENISVQLSWKYQFQFAPMIAAYEKGFYRDAGLEVSLIEGGPGIDAVIQVSEGRADYGIYSSALLVKYSEGFPVVALAAMMQHSPVALIAEQTKAGSVLDLAGKTIAVSPDTRDEIIAYLRASGIPNDRVNIVPKTLLGLDSLQHTDAVSAYISNEGFYLGERGKHYLLMSPRAAGIDLFGNILFTSRQKIKMNPEQVKAFKEATLKGLQYSLENPAELTEIILARYNSQNKTREHLLYEAQKMHELTRPDIVEPGYMSPGRWRHVADVYTSMNKIPADIELTPFIYDPDPSPDLRWLYSVFSVVLLILVIVSLALLQTRRLTRQLKQEMRERKQAETERQASDARFKELFDKNPDPCWLMTTKKMLECNDACFKVLNYPGKTQLLRQPINMIMLENIVQGQTSAKLSDQYDLTVEKGIHRFEWQFQTFSGKLIPVEVTMTMYTLNATTIIYCIWRDISERKHIEKLKDEFISTVSHELRTPLTSLIGALGLIEGGSVGSLPDKASSLVKISHKNSKQLLNLINDILDLSKIEAGKMDYHMKDVDIVDLIHQAIDNNATYSQKSNHHFSFSPPQPTLHVFGDANRLLQVLNNLLSNAIKFSPVGSRIELSAFTEENSVIIVVRDYGCGIPELFQSRLFEKFSQADSSDTRQSGGTGLGLSISKAIIEAHQGILSFESKENEGTSFFIRLAQYSQP